MLWFISLNVVNLYMWNMWIYACRKAYTHVRENLSYIFGVNVWFEEVPILFAAIFDLTQWNLLRFWKFTFKVYTVHKSCSIVLWTEVIEIGRCLLWKQNFVIRLRWVNMSHWILDRVYWYRNMSDFTVQWNWPGRHTFDDVHSQTCPRIRLCIEFSCTTLTETK